MQKKNRDKWRLNEKIIVGLIFLLFLFLRLYNILNWRLANVDEVSALNQLNMDWLSGGSASTSFWPLTIITKVFYPILGFPGLRILIPIISVISLWFFYRELRYHLELKARLLILGWLSLSWYSIYIMRLYEVGSLVIAIAIASLMFLFRYLRTKSFINLLGCWVVFTIGINVNATPFLYGTIPLIIFSLWEIWKKHIKLKEVILLFIISLIILTPYIWIVTTKDPLTKAPLWTYGMVNEPETEPIIGINIKHPWLGLMSVTFFFFGPNIEGWLGLVSILLLLTPIFLWFWSKRSRLTTIILSGYIIMLFLFSISTAPIYHQGQLHLLFILWIILIGSLFSLSKIYQIIIGITFSCLFLFQILWWPVILEDQVSAVEEILSEQFNRKKVVISDGARLKLTHIPDAINPEWKEFYCLEKLFFDFFEKNPITNQQFVIATSECPIQELCIDKKCQVEKLLDLPQLQEPHLQHGMAIFKINSE